MEDRSLPIVIVGHVDHGKSTLIGRLFHDTGCIPESKMEELRRISKEQGKEMEFAFLMDHLEEERTRGITIDIAHTFFNTDKRKYVIIDAPGHKEFMKNMISGSSQAEAALMLVDVNSGIEEQTRRHCYVLSLLGIKQVAVMVNKMDLVDYSEDAFNKVKDDIVATLGQLDITPAHVIPLSAMAGENIAKKSDKLPWFDGLSVLQVLDDFHATKVEDRDLRFPIQDVYDVDGEAIAVGRVESGLLKSGAEFFVLPENDKCTVSAIKKFMEEDLTEAPVGDCVGVSVTGTKLKRGDVLTATDSATITDSVTANIFWMTENDFSFGLPFLWKCATQAIPCKIEKIYKRFDPASTDLPEEDAKEIKNAEVAQVLIKLEAPGVIDKFSDIAEMGRFVLEHQGYPVAGGIVI